MLLPVKLNATVLASIGIDRHRSLSFINSHYSPASKRFQEEAGMSSVNNLLTTMIVTLGIQRGRLTARKAKSMIGLTVGSTGQSRAAMPLEESPRSKEHGAG